MKRTPKKRPLVEMLVRYAEKNGFKVERAETSCTRLYDSMGEMEKLVDKGTIVVAKASTTPVSICICVDFATAGSTTFTNTLKMLSEMAGAKVEQRLSTSKAQLFCAHR